MIRPEFRIVAVLLALATAGAWGSVPARSLAAEADAADPLAGLDEALQKGDVPGALSMAREAADSARARLAGEPSDLASSLEGLALRLLQGANGTADTAAAGEALLHESLDLRVRALGEDHLDVARSLDLLSTAHYDQGRFDDAEAEERRCLAIRLRRLSENDRPAAEARYGLGAILFKEGRYAEAEPLLLAAVAVFRLTPSPWPGQLADSLNTLAELYRSQDRYGEAEERFLEAIRIAEAEGDESRPQQARLANNLAGLYKDEGRYDDAEILLRRSLDLRTRAVPADAGDLATAWLNLAELERLRGRFQEAEPLYAKALELARRALGPDNPDLAWFLNQRSVLYREEDRPEDAEPPCREALALLRRTLGERHFMVAQSLHDLGTVLRSRGAFEEAEQDERSALAIRREVYGDRHPDVALTLVELARTLDARGRHDEALDNVADALEILERTNAYPEARADALALRADLRWRSGERARAIDDQLRAVGLVEAIRPHAGGGEEARATFLGQHTELFERLVLWLLEDGRIAAAFEYAERARSRALLDQLQMARVDLLGAIPEPLRSSLAEQQRAAASRLAELQERVTFTRSRSDLSSEERGRRLAGLEKDLDDASRVYAAIYDEIRNASPLWRDTTGGTPMSLEAARRQIVPSGGALLLYVIGQKDSGLLVLPQPPRSPSFHHLEVDRAAATMLGIPAGPLRAGDLGRVLDGGLLRALARPSATGSLMEEAERDAAGHPLSARLSALFRVLVPRRVWASLKPATEVVVLPDGPLHRLPFEALVTKAGRGPASARYWLDEGPPLRYAASATLLQRLAARGPVQAGGVLSVSDPLYDAADGAAILRGRFEPEGSPLARLPGTARETRAIVEAFAGAGGPGVTVLEGREADEPRVRAELPGKRYVHFATHGLVDQERGQLFAALALTPAAVETGRTEDDGYLQLFEIYGLDVSCELAVLSACGTQAGRRVEGEGVFALSRGFLAAGARRVIASQWSVDDASTAVLVGELFRRIAAAEKDGRTLPFAAALRDAKRAVRGRPEWASPFYWSPFVLSGIR
jgi:tetratricopeptide (TPR) repeat protein